MDITIFPKKLSGSIQIVPSKSVAHRVLICAAFADRPTVVHCPGSNEDIDATVQCLNALGAAIKRADDGFFVTPIQTPAHTAVLNCGESGSTLRFLLPIVGALGVDATFILAGRLGDRPLSPLWEELCRMGLTLTRPQKDRIQSTGRLRPGLYSIAGNVSSQFITGLMFALSLMAEPSRLTIVGKVESAPYIHLTRQALACFGVDADHLGGQPLQSPGCIAVEGDWSNGAFFLAANALGSKIELLGLSADSAQGDRACASLIPSLTQGFQTIDARDIPDLVPILAVVAAAKHGAEFTGIQRLRAKESDRVASVCALLEALGARADAFADRLVVHPAVFHGGTVCAFSDHRIAMSAAIAATVATGPVTILGAQCVSKSYPGFWQEYANAGGNYEQLLR